VGGGRTISRLHIVPLAERSERRTFATPSSYTTEMSSWRRWAGSHPERVALMDDSQLETGGWNFEALSPAERAKEMNGSDEFSARGAGVASRHGKL
jgi:hypothetical protein